MRIEPVRTTRHTRRAVSVALAALVAGLSFGANPASAQPVGQRDAVTVFAPPPPPPTDIDPEPAGSGRVVHEVFAFNAGGAAAARAWIQNPAHCGNSFCLIHSYQAREYRAYKLTGCTTYDLDNFTGRFHAKNHGTFNVHLLDESYRFLAEFWPGRYDDVDWRPVGKIRLCQR
jgi:hypothetical protein